MFGKTIKAEILSANNDIFKNAFSKRNLKKSDFIDLTQLRKDKLAKRINFTNQRKTEEEMDKRKKRLITKELKKKEKLKKLGIDYSFNGFV
ncbi:hypothetical protein MHBO_004937 [Bonamia ostreae]|uniref:Uncharacterized protein n=1 Tax=Bonamia ostreae TaxID=126728 RepID=A0ABV2AUN8_9EUKA